MLALLDILQKLFINLTPLSFHLETLSPLSFTCEGLIPFPLSRGRGTGYIREASSLFGSPLYLSLQTSPDKLPLLKRFLK